MNLLLALAILAAQEEDVRKLENGKVSVDFRDTSLEDAIDFVREFAAINLIVDPRVHDRRVTLKLRDVSLKSCLRLMLRPLDLKLAYREGAWVVVPREAAGRLALRVYDVRDVLLKVQDFPGPKVELSGPGQAPDVIITLPDEPKGPISEDFLLEMVRANTGGDSWEGGEASVSLANGMLVVIQSRVVQDEVASLLARLRRFR